MDEQKRVNLRSTEQLKAKFSFQTPKGNKNEEGMILDISAGGVKMIVKTFIVKDKIVECDIKFPNAKIAPKGRVIDSLSEWYMIDGQKEMYCTCRIAFTEITFPEKQAIITYVYSNLKDRPKEG